MIRRPPRSTPFPTRRSSDLVDSSAIEAIASCAGSMKNAYLSVMPRLLNPLACGSSWGFGVMSSHSLKSVRSEEHMSELQSQSNLVCRLLLEKKKRIINNYDICTVPSFSFYFSHYSDLHCL